MSKRKAQALTEKIRHGLLLTEKSLKEFVAGEGWLVMGYESFSAWWTAEIPDITLPPAARVQVVYAMLGSGASDVEIATSVRGIGHGLAESLRHQRSMGVPAEGAALTAVPAHNRQKPSSWSTTHVTLGPEKLRAYTALAVERGTTLDLVGRDLFASWYAESRQPS